MATPKSSHIEPPPRARLVEFAGAAFDEEAIGRADSAVAKVLARYPTLLADEVAKLVAAWAAAPDALNSETVAPIFARAHELAGYGETFGYPLITILARSLCRLLTMGDLSRGQMATVVDAHIATLHVIVRDHIQGHGGELGLSLAASLDKAIAKFHLTSSSDRDGRLREEVAALQPKK
jgi:hypothetical protein